MNLTNLQPKKRSSIRLALGKQYFITKRYIKWITDRKVFSTKKTNKSLPYRFFSHQTILLRKLKDVEMEFQYNKIINLQLAVSKLNNIIIYPGETLSYWKIIGKPTYKKGYVDGMILYSGSFKKGVGGGLCQLSNLIYWMTLHTPLTVTERHRHSYDVFPDSKRSQPFGSGATCAYNYLDLQIKNETDEPFQLCLELDDTHLKGEWRGTSLPLYTYKVYEREHQITPAYFGGYVRHNQIFRKIYNRQQIEVGDEYITENHAMMMYEPLLSYEERVE
jgi:vancomycin resistance protein VanW